jgi:hypothetical protein
MPKNRASIFHATRQLKTRQAFLKFMERLTLRDRAWRLSYCGGRRAGL